MKNKLIWLLATLMLCGCKPSASQIASTHASMVPIVAYLDQSLKTDKVPPADDMELERDFRAATGTPLPGPTEYVSGVNGEYQLWCYVKGRVSLWYVADKDPEFAGWWVDDDSGDERVRYNPGE